MTTVRRWTGLEARALRIAFRLSVRAFAEDLGVAGRTVSKWEAGAATTVPRPDTQAILDTALGRADGDAQQRFEQLCSSGALTARRTSRVDPPAVHEPGSDDRGSVLALGSHEWGPEHSNEFATLLQSGAAVPVTAENVTRLMLEWLVAEPPQLVEVTAGRLVGTDLVEKVERRVAQLRRMDDFVAGGDLHELVERELTTTAELLRDAAYSEVTGRRLLVAIGELCQLAGWVTADAGASQRAARYYTLGVTAAYSAGERPLAANLISTLAYHTSNTGKRHDAVLSEPNRLSTGYRRRRRWTGDEPDVSGAEPLTVIAAQCIPVRHRVDSLPRNESTGVTAGATP